jgi:hypothetical protein
MSAWEKSHQERSAISGQRSALLIKTIGCIIPVNQALLPRFDNSWFMLIANS